MSTASTTIEHWPLWDAPFKDKTKSWKINGPTASKSRPGTQLDANSILSTVSRWLPPRDIDSDYWWKMAGPHLATLMHNAGYSVEAQYEALLFFYHQIVPSLGLSPLSGNLASEEGDSGLSLDGTHFEYSWRWNQPDTKPEIRMVVEPFSRLAGTYMDPLNLKPATEILYSMLPKCPSLDMSLFNHFIGKFYDAAHHKYLETNERSVRTNVCLGFEFLGCNILPKAYFFPRKLGQVGITPMDVWEDAIATAGPHSDTMDKVFSFVKNDAPELGLSLTPLWLGIDVVSPADARLKLYCVESRTSFTSVTSILTMGGRIHIDPGMLDSAWELMKAVCGLPADVGRDMDLPRAPKYNASTDGVDTVGLWGTFAYYFDIGARQEDSPDIKVYIPVCHYGVNDEAIATALTNWMKANGRGQYVEAYWSSLRTMITHRGLEESRGAHMWVSMMVKGGKLQVTSYIAPEGHHPKRQAGVQKPHNRIAERVARDNL